MANKLDTQAMGKYAAMGAGAVAVPALVANIEMVQTLMQNQIMQFGFAGITVGGVLMAAIGVGAVDMLVYGK